MSKISTEYQQLIERFPLRPLKTEDDLDKALVISLELRKKGDALSEDANDYLSMLTDAIQKYEDERHRVNTDDVKPHHILQDLMDEHGLGQSDLRIILGLSAGRVSELVNGKRDFTKEQLTLLAMRFNVSPSAFLPKRKNSEPIVFEPEGRYIKIEEAIKQAIDKAVITGNTYVFDCNGLMMTINKTSKYQELVNAYWHFIDIQPDQNVSATFSLFE